MRSRTIRWCLCAIAFALAGPAAAQADLGPRLGGCGDVRFIGVMGSGESGDAYDDYGREMATLSDDIRDALPGWVEFKSNPIHYPAYSTELIQLGQIDRYASGIDDGDQALRDFLGAVQDVCPDELEILAGYSSGAMVVHDILDEIADSDYWTRRIIGVHLLADPRRTGIDPTTRGGAGNGSWGIAAIGEWVTLLHGTAEVPPVFWPVTKSWCANKDPICALTFVDLLLLPSVWGNAWRHSSYGLSILPNLFADEARRLTRRLRLRFPDTPQFLDTVATGWPVSVDLKNGFSHAVRFTGISPEIPGLKLAANGRLSGVASTVGYYHPEATAVTDEGGTTTFDVYLSVVEPFDMVDFDPDPVVLPPMPIHEPTGVVLPGIPARSVVTLEPDDTMPAGLTLSATGKVQGRPDLVGDFDVGVRVAKPDGSLRRFRLTLQIVNSAKLASAAADGTPADSGVGNGIMLDDSRVAFASAASNLGVDNPDGNELVYVKDVGTGALAHWTPPQDEYVCALQTDAAKTSLYVVTARWQERTNENGEVEGEEHTTLRRLPVAGAPSAGGELAPSTVASYAGDCDGGAGIAASSARGAAVISAYRLDLPDQPYGGGAQRLYVLGANGWTSVPSPPSDGLAWLPVAVTDVRSDGALLIEERRTVNDPEGLPASETGYFLLAPTGALRRVDLDAAGAPIAMLSPRFYAGGIVFSVRNENLRASLARVAVIIITSGALRFKPIAPADPAPFDSLGINTTSGIQPLTASDYAVGCSTYKRSKPSRVEPTIVYFGGAQIDGCIASPPGSGPSPFSAGGPSTMLVSGSLGDGRQQLLVGAVP